jgi:pimeloyl-ACP methyl ester carboxylesterase
MDEYRIEIPQGSLDELRQRIDATRWPADPPGSGWERGVPQDYLRRLARYWSTEYDWRAAEAELNRHPQFSTEIDGANVHFLHVRSPEPTATPLLLTHGWPSSVAEFLDVIGPLTDPVAHGGTAEEAFHLVIPSIPGYGFSGPLRDYGWTVPRTARAWAELMRRLGYDRYLAQGGDFGSFISLELGRIDADHVIGVHTSLLLTIPSGAPGELDGLSEQDQDRLARLGRFDADGSAYMKLMMTRPQTSAYAFNDSPVGLLAWIVERYREWTSPASSLAEAIDIDRILTTVSTYWFTGTVAASAQFYYEDAKLKQQDQAAAEPVTVPIGVAVFPDDCFLPLRRLAERDFPTITHWTEFDRGGHFPALEVPQHYVTDVRAFAKSLHPVTHPAQ